MKSFSLQISVDIFNVAAIKCGPKYTERASAATWTGTPDDHAVGLKRQEQEVA